MTEPGAVARRWAWGLCAGTVGMSVAQVGLLMAGGIPLFAPESLDEPFPTVTLAVVIGAVVGAAVVDQHPRHRVGWLFCTGQFGAAVGLTAQALALAVLPGDLSLPEPVGHVAGWTGSLFGASYALTLLGLVLLRVPDGHLPSARWRPIEALLVGGFTVATIGVLLVPPSRFGATEAVDAGSLAIGLAEGGQLAMTAGLAGSTVALGVRLRRTTGEERQQLRWMAAAAATVAFAVAAIMLDGLVRGVEAPQRWYLQQVLYLSYLTFQVATGFAVLRYRLYDIDLIIGRTVRLGILALFVTVGYVSAVVAIGSVLAGSSSGVWPSLFAYVLVALAFQPLRRQVDRFADRVVYGQRAVPYDNLAELSRQLAAGWLSDRELLELSARCSALAVGARSARATISVPGEVDRSADWPRGTEHRADVALPVIDRDEVLGRIELGLRPGHVLTRAQRRLVDELTAEVALAFHNVRLTAALQRRAEELSSRRADLEASRRRLLTAADTERERVARCIRADVAVYLEPLSAALADVGARMARDPVAAERTLDRLQQDMTRAIDALRSITAGVVPPLLVRRGLGPAVRAHLARIPGLTTVTIGPGVPDRLDPSVETAAYHCVLRAVDAVAPGSQVSLDVADSCVELTVRGRRIAELPDRQQVLDRVQAVGGQLEDVDRGDGEVEIRALLPLDPSAQAAVSRPGSNSDFST